MSEGVGGRKKITLRNVFSSEGSGEVTKDRVLRGDWGERRGLGEERVVRGRARGRREGGVEGEEGGGELRN